ncbi:MAG: T9SS type A sorting domain-containing protein [Bacteroidota bacterium]
MTPFNIHFTTPLNTIIMKTSTPLKLFIVLMMSTLTTGAQNYDFTLIQNSQYNYTIAAVSQFDSGSYQPLTQSYGFTLVLPDGAGITIDEVLPAGTNETVTPFAGTSVVAFDPTMADKDLFLVTTDTQGNAIASHGNGQVIPLITLTVTGAPPSGEIRLLDNGSTLASAAPLNGALDSFFQVDIIDDATITFNNEFNALTGDAAFDFAVLSVGPLPEEAQELSLYPNPAKDTVAITGDTSKLDLVEIYSINGQLVKTITNKLEAIDIEELEAAMYMVKLYSGNNTATLKLIKE